MTTIVSVRDAGYMAQRSTNSKMVLDFLNALPKGTLESGVELIPNFEEVKKRFKLRSPKMTKALIKLGVDPAVVAGYYSAFSQASSVSGVYHVTTFSNADIMRQQSDSTHYTSCMRSGRLPGQHRGCYYDDCISSDITAYECGDLALWVVGNHSRNIESDGVIHDGNGSGFLARAKVRVLYAVNQDDEGVYSLLERRALLIDQVYGSASLLFDQIADLIEWNEETYNLPILVRGRYTAATLSLDVSEFFQPFGSLVHPHEGYHDNLSITSMEVAVNSFGENHHPLIYNVLSANRKKTIIHVAMLYSSSGYSLLNQESSSKIHGLQYKAFMRARRSNDEKLSSAVPLSKVFIERGSDKLVCRDEQKNYETYWRYEYLASRSNSYCLDRLRSMSLTKFCVRDVLNSILKELKVQPFEEDKNKQSGVGNESFRFLIDDGDSKSLVGRVIGTYEDTSTFVCYLTFSQAKEDETGALKYVLAYSQYFRYKQTADGWQMASSNLSLHDFTKLCSYYFETSTFFSHWIEIPDDAITKAYRIVCDLSHGIKVSLPRIDNLPAMRYNKRRIKKLIKL